MFKERLKDIIRKKPLVKRLAKHLLKGVSEKNKRSEIRRYHQWLDQVELENDGLAIQRKEAKKLEYQPLISVVTPTYNTPTAYFKEMIESVQSQTYENWELVLVDDASPDETVRNLIKEWAGQDSRIKYKFLEKGLHIAGATNVAIEQASGEFISLFDHDDVLRPDALYEIVVALNSNRDLDFIYTDEDKIIDSKSLRADPFFKPNWNQDFLYSVNYITHFTTIRKEILLQVGCEDGRFNGAQDWELFLRITRSIDKDKIHHIPKVLYSWRVHPNSTAQSLGAKPYVLEAQRRAIDKDLKSKNIHNFELSQDTLYSAQWKINFSIKQPTYSVIDLNTDIETVMKHIDDEVIIFSSKDLKSSEVNELIADALRVDIGFVVPRANNKHEVISFLEGILIKEVRSYIESVRDSLSYHYYRTARYNIVNISDAHTLAIEKAKILKVLKDNKGINNLQDVADLLLKDGYRHLYNPYVKV